MKKADAILCSDIHLRDTQPECRTDDFNETQIEKLVWLSGLQKVHNCPVLDAGDIFHKWKPSPELLSNAITYMPDQMITVAGNHDLPQHNIHEIHRSGLYTLKVAGKLTILSNNTASAKERNWRVFGLPWESCFDETEQKVMNAYPQFRKVLIIHTLVYKDATTLPFWANKKYDFTAKQLLQKYPGFDLIISGHNHQTFTYEHKGRLLVNPGSLTRQSIAEMENRSCVFLWYAEENKLEKVYVPIEEDITKETKAVEALKKEKRLTSFVKSLKDQKDLKLSFPGNMTQYLGENKISKPIKTYIREAME